MLYTDREVFTLFTFTFRILFCSLFTLMVEPEVTWPVLCTPADRETKSSCRFFSIVRIWKLGSSPAHLRTRTRCGLRGETAARAADT